MRAIVLAAGLGSRLRPLTLERPKPAVPFGLAPMACVSLQVLADLGVRRVVMNTHHLGDRLPDLLAPHLPVGLEVTYLHEETLLGTGGGLRHAAAHLDDGDPVLVLNSDIVFRPDLEGAIARHAELAAVATMVVRPDPDAERFGAIDVDARFEVQRLLGTPARAHGAPLQRYMFTGVHVLSPDAFADLPERGCIVQHAYRRWVDDADRVVAAHVDDSPWTDIGTLAAYLEANLALGDVVHPSARVERSSLERCVLGEGAHVTDASLTRVVVWPGARVGAELDGLHDAIVTPTHVVRVAV